MKNTDKPDYKMWAQKDIWTLKEGVLLLLALNPVKYRSLRPYNGKLAPELSEVEDAYMIMRAVPWKERYAEFHSYNGLHPIAIIREALNKGMHVPKILLNAVNERFEREKAKQAEALPEPILPSEEINKTKMSPEPILTTRERSNLLKTIGILVQMHFSGGENSAPRYNRGNKLNAYQITQTIIEKAYHMGINPEGLKSMDRKITEALELLEESAN